MQLMMRRPEIGGFISISPPANTEDFSFLAPCPSSGLVIHGDKDEQVPLESVNKLVQKITSQKNITVDLSLIKGADHFYQAKVEEVDKAVDAYLTKALAPETEKA